MLFILPGLVLFGCDSDTQRGDGDAGDAGLHDDAGALADGDVHDGDGGGNEDAGDEELRADQLLVEYLVGVFNSEEQSIQDPSYYNVQLTHCYSHSPQLGENVLYVEQALVGSTPYRQRVYVIRPFDDPSEGAISEVWKVIAPHMFIGFCDDPREIRPHELELAEGCESYLTLAAGEFVGGTDGASCLNDFGGALYATSEITVDEDSLTSWDRGYNASDIQVWGAVFGPYIFERRTTRLSYPEIIQ